MPGKRQLEGEKNFAKGGEKGTMVRSARRKLAFRVSRELSLDGNQGTICYFTDQTVFVENIVMIS